jgi:septum formation topological specificity factor MinE
MLTINLSATDDFDAVELSFEHSLVSLSKWESLTKKAFFSKEEKTSKETASYIECMLLTDDVPSDFLNRLSKEDVAVITSYINDKQSATWFREESNQKKSSEVITSELIYYWLVQFNIPFEVERWHLNRLMTLVKIAGIKQTKPKAMSKAEQANEYRRLNAERRAASGSSG